MDADKAVKNENYVQGVFKNFLSRKFSWFETVAVEKLLAKTTRRNIREETIQSVNAISERFGLFSVWGKTVVPEKFQTKQAPVFSLPSHTNWTICIKTIKFGIEYSLPKEDTATGAVERAIFSFENRLLFFDQFLITFFLFSFW